MEALKRSYIFFFVAAVYLYHLGTWTYRMEGFEFSQLAQYPSDVIHTSYAYLVVIFAFILSGVLSIINSPKALHFTLISLSVPALYESYRIVTTLSFFGVVEPDLFYAHLGIRLSFGLLVVICIYNGLQLRKSFNKHSHSD